MPGPWSRRQVSLGWRSLLRGAPTCAVVLATQAWVWCTSVGIRNQTGWQVLSGTGQSPGSKVQFCLGPLVWARLSCVGYGSEPSGLELTFVVVARSTLVHLFTGNEVCCVTFSSLFIYF